MSTVINQSRQIGSAAVDTPNRKDVIFEVNKTKNSVLGKRKRLVKAAKKGARSFLVESQEGSSTINKEVQSTTLYDSTKMTCSVAPNLASKRQRTAQNNFSTTVARETDDALSELIGTSALG